MATSLTDFLAKIPGVSDVQQRLSAVRAKFLAIPQTNDANKSTLARIRAQTNDAGEVAKIDTLIAKARAVESGFQSVVSQFSAFDDLKRAGAPTAQLVTTGASLLAAAQGVQNASDAVTAGVRPLAQKYGQPVVSQGDLSLGKGAVVFALGAVGLVMLLRPKKGKRR